MLTASSTRAGTYVWNGTDPKTGKYIESPTTSGGSILEDGTTTVPYGSQGDPPYGTVNYSASKSLVCSGAISSTFTWQPTAGQTLISDPPPVQVVVQETCYVDPRGWAYPNAQGQITLPTGSADNGLGVTSGMVYTPLTGGEVRGEAYCGSTRYTVHTGGPTIALTCSPYAQIAVASGTAFYTSVSYSANVYPLTVNLTGGIGSSTAKHILIGQQLTATLSTGPLTPTTYSWGVSGGVAFKNYTANNSNAVYTPLGYETGSQLVTYFCQPTTAATVSCLIHLAVPAGASPASGIDVTPTQTLTVEKPSALLDVAIGSVTDLPTSTNPNGVQLQQFYTYPQSGNAEGISWNGTLTTPAAYVTAGNYGSWNWTQLITAQRQQKNNGVYWQFAVNTTTPATVINGISVLDGSYPYGYFWYPSDGTRTGNADSPYQPLDSSVTIREYDVSDSFNDYLMYLPPGSGSLPVAMKRSSWYWDFQALKDPTNAWSTSGKNAQWGFVGDFPAFPTWSFNAAIGHLVYVAP